MRKHAKSAKKFVVKHKVAFAVTGTALVMLYMNHLAFRQYEEFLKEHDLYDAFFHIED
jgi:hypothetical protein